MDGNGEHRPIATKDCRCSVAMMHVRVHDHGLSDGALGLQFADGHGHIVNRAESFSVVGVRMMKAAAQIRSEPVSERGARVVPPAASQTASTSSGEYGTSSRMTSLGVSVPVFSLRTHSSV